MHDSPQSCKRKPASGSTGLRNDGTYVSPDDADMPGFSVFTRRDGVIHHFYTSEMSGDMAGPGQDPRGAPDLDPL